MKNNVSIVISCAGMGTRLGLGCTKALVEIEGKTLIERQLEILKDYDDIRIVVGYQAEKVIEVVNAIRKDILFVFNHDYRNTGTGASFWLGAQHAREYVVALDGDLLVHPEDLIRAVDYDGPCVGGTTPSTDNPWSDRFLPGVGRLRVDRLGQAADRGPSSWQTPRLSSDRAAASDPYDFYSDERDRHHRRL